MSRDCQRRLVAMETGDEAVAGGAGRIGEKEQRKAEPFPYVTKSHSGRKTREKKQVPRLFVDPAVCRFDNSRYLPLSFSAFLLINHFLCVRATFSSSGTVFSIDSIKLLKTFTSPPDARLPFPRVPPGAPGKLRIPTFPST